jgi:MYXO-CTERM domain-containing protein
MSKVITRAAIAAAILTLSPAAAIAQNDVGADNTVAQNDVAFDNTTDVAPVQREEDHDFPWGLLGLLGLAGLLGRKRRDPDIHVDARHDTRP